MELQDVYQILNNDLQIIEKRLAETVYTEQSDLRSSSRHLLDAGGKRMRPMYVLLAGRLGKYNQEKLTKVAVALELIHMATLVHDDVIDDADTRRGRETVKAKWDNRVAMYTGDYIISRALLEIGQIQEQEPHQVLSKAIYAMCRGEIDQIRDLYRIDQNIKNYLYRVKRKTALLMAISCQLGAIVSQASSSLIYQMYRYGYYVGMAFQLTDDILDLTGDEKALGKPAGSDIRQGNVTLPVIYALQHAPLSDQEYIKRYLQEQGDGLSLEKVITSVKDSGGIEFARSLSSRYLNKAKQILHPLPSSEEKEALQMLAEFIVNRSY